MFSVIHEIHFSYGHRLLHYKGKCARLHGHNARVQVEVSAKKLDRLGMVVDFYKIRECIGQWINQHLDHQMILSRKDPVAKLLQKQREPVVLIDANPTAEVLAKMIFDYARKKRLPVSKVTFWETPKSSAVYHE